MPRRKESRGTSKMTFSKYRDFRDPNFFHKCTTVGQFWILLHIFLTTQLIGIFLYTSTRCAYFFLLKSLHNLHYETNKIFFLRIRDLGICQFLEFSKTFFLSSAPFLRRSRTLCQHPLGLTFRLAPPRRLHGVLTKVAQTRFCKTVFFFSQLAFILSSNTWTFP